MENPKKDKNSAGKMNTIKIGFTGFWPHFDKEEFLCTRALRKKYDVKIVDAII